MGSLVKFPKHMRKKWYQFSTISFRRWSSGNTSWLLLWSQHNPKSQNQTKTLQDNCRPLFLKNRNAKILNKIRANQTKHIKRIIHHDHAGFIPGIQGWFIQKSINIIHHINKPEKEKKVTWYQEIQKKHLTICNTHPW